MYVTAAIARPKLSTARCTPTYPDVELDVLVGDGLHVEPHRGDRVDRLPQLQLVEYGRLAGGVEAEHEYPHLLVPEHLRQYLPHDDDFVTAKQSQSQSPLLG